MKARSLFVKLVIAAFPALMTPCLWGQDGLEGALPRANHASPPNLTALFGQTLAVADFDNDHKLDGAVLVDSGWLRGQNSYRIEIHLSGSNNTEVSFESAETALAIIPSDVNKDGKTDVVVEQPLTHKRLYVWLNDGHGGFHKGRVEDFPSDSSGTGEQSDAPSRWPDCPAVCLAPQRGSEMTMLAASSLRGRPPSASEMATFAVALSPVLSAFSAKSSRAPPLFLSL